MYTISPKKVTVIIDSQKGYYLNAIKPLTSSASLELVNSANIHFSTTANSNSKVGTYEITGTYDNKNYDITFENGTYEIVKKKSLCNFFFRKLSCLKIFFFRFFC